MLLIKKNNNDILTLKTKYEAENELADLRNEPLKIKERYPFFMDKDLKDIILKVNHTKVLCKDELEKDKIYTANLEFTFYDFENTEKEQIRGWSVSVTK